MNLESQLESTGDPHRGDVRLCDATFEDLSKEMKMRCSSMMIVAMMQDENGDDQVVVSKRGSSFEVLGMIETMRHDMIRRVVQDV